LVAVILTDEITRDYLLNYARSLIYTTSLSYANIIAIDCSFDFLENGVAEQVRIAFQEIGGLRTKEILQLSSKLLSLSICFMDTLQNLIVRHAIPPALLSLPPHLSSTQTSTTHDIPRLSPMDRATPIVPVFTSRPRPLSAHLRANGMNARPITWPTVPKGLDRVRVCLHASNTPQEVDMLARVMIEWARGEMAASAQVQEVKQTQSLALQSKL
jgi:8-amino-7-oxononanoate synthase